MNGFRLQLRPSSNVCFSLSKKKRSCLVLLLFEIPYPQDCSLQLRPSSKCLLFLKKRPLRCLVNKSGGPPAWEPPPPAPPSGILQGASQASRSFPGLQRASPASLPPPRSPLREPPGSLQGASESFPGLQRASRASPPSPPQEVNCVGATSSKKYELCTKGSRRSTPRLSRLHARLHSPE